MVRSSSRSKTRSNAHPCQCPPTPRAGPQSAWQPPKIPVRKPLADLDLPAAAGPHTPRQIRSNWRT
eukprot:5816783-Pyramimonas_sp.AAC.1